MKTLKIMNDIGRIKAKAAFETMGIHSPEDQAEVHEEARQNAQEIIREYEKEFPRGTPIVCACEKGRLKHVRLLIEGHDVLKTGISVNEMISMEGRDSSGVARTPLGAAAFSLLPVKTDDDIKQKAQRLARKLEKDFPKGTPIVCACEKGRWEHVRLLVEGHDVLKTGMSANEMISMEGKDSNGLARLPIGAAAENEELKVVKYLVTTFSGKIIETRDMYGRNSIHYAAWKSKKKDLLKYLLDNCSGDVKSIINAKNNIGYTPLDTAYASNSNTKPAITDLLRDEGGQISGTFSRLKHKYHPRYPLHVASGKKCDKSDVITLVDVCGLDVNAKDADGKTSVYYAAYHKNYNVVNILIQKGAKKQDKRMGTLAAYEKDFPQGTPLVCACEKKNLEDVQLLVEQHDALKTGISVNRMISMEGRDMNGIARTPLGAAVEKKASKIVDYLIKNCTDNIVEKVDSYGCNSLHYAAWKLSNNDIQLLKTLIDNCKEKEESINAKAKDGRTPLDYAYTFNSNSKKDLIIKKLEKAGGQLDNYYLYDKKGRLIVPRKLIKQKAPAVKKKEETTAVKKKEKKEKKAKKAKKQKKKNKIKN